MRKLLIFGLAAAFVLPAWALDNNIKMPVNLDRLAARATESVDVTLDASMLELASKFLSQDDPDQAHVKKLVSKLKGVYVRSFEFDKEGQYSMSDVESLRRQLKAPEWSRIVGVRSLKGENFRSLFAEEREQNRRSFRDRCGTEGADDCAYRRSYRSGGIKPVGRPHGHSKNRRQTRKREERWQRPGVIPCGVPFF